MLLTYHLVVSCHHFEKYEITDLMPTGFNLLVMADCSSVV